MSPTIVGRGSAGGGAGLFLVQILSASAQPLV